VTQARQDAPPAGANVVFFDGVCGLCNALVQFLLKRDRREHLLYAQLQGEFAERTLARFQVDANELNSAYFLTNYGTPQEALYAKGAAALRMLIAMGGMYKLANIGLVVPEFIVNSAYELIAKNRYRLFGKRTACMVPSKNVKRRFLD
jgi:predicted DCC family thiol-disulfide oxidoreductase YuxK